MIDLARDALTLASGGLVGFSLGLVGGGGSILAVPLLVYLVGIGDAHVAIGTSAVAVASNAGINLVSHARKGAVKWRCASVFAAAGVVGALIGSLAGRQVDGDNLLALFAVLMLVVGGLMLKNRSGQGLPDVRLSAENGPRLVGLGFGTGLLSGFFGIGGGFLIVPGLILATGMPILNAMASSLVGVAAFGVTTASSYAWAGLVDWRVAGIFIAGGVVGGLIGARVARIMNRKRGALKVLFAGLIFVVALYMLARTVGPF
jgi:uncharacterized membrane protein YfcA